MGVKGKGEGELRYEDELLNTSTLIFWFYFVLICLFVILLFLVFIS